MGGLAGLGVGWVLRWMCRFFVDELENAACWDFVSDSFDAISLPNYWYLYS
jgi:hypothetical protein